ncbi:hypothetical protein [Marinoscillum pacificum]|uniref:hypothetical protein n=1 Tax=Marinoscillum pacificum TaxID=392723 RepID=UPI0021571C44|nr:hypothetical protein [Marinoscillum pacificum]
MKAIKFACLTMVVCLLASCRNDVLLEERGEGLYSSSLSSKPAILKLSFVENTQRKAEFAEGQAVEFGLTYLEEPKSEKKRVYLEVYEDLTFGKQVEYLPTNSGFPADDWELPSDMPKVTKFVYVNGLVQGFDKSGNVIFEDAYEDQYWISPEEFGSAKLAAEFAVKSFYKPSEVAQKAIEIAKKGAAKFEDLDEAFQLTRYLDVEVSSSARSGDQGEVVREETYILPEYGVVYRTEGYTSSGKLKDIEHNFYTKNDDGVIYQASSHYRNVQYSEAYDIYFTEHSDIFYSEFKIETSLDL